MKLNVNTDAAVILTNKLEKLNRSAFPVAVRGALNDAAFDVKKTTLPKSAARNFTTRNANFFKTFSGVNKATGFNVNRMSAVVGMTDLGKPSARTAVGNMEKQELGGIISEGADYLAAARGGSNSKKVSRSNYFNKSNLIKGSFKHSGTSKSRLVAAAFAAQKNKKQLSVNTSKGRFLMRVTSVTKRKNGTVKINSRLLMKDRGAKPVKITATHFSKEAAMETTKKLSGFYIKQAEKQFAKALK